MKDENILDSDIFDVNQSIMESVKWWESRRKWYNLILFVFGLILVLRDLYAILFLGLSLTIIFIIIYGVCANLFYSLGWGVEILLKYYLDSPIEKYPRQFLYVLGLIFSLIITSVIFFRVVYIISVNF